MKPESAPKRNAFSVEKPDTAVDAVPSTVTGAVSGYRYGDERTGLSDVSKNQWITEHNEFSPDPDDDANDYAGNHANDDDSDAGAPECSGSPSASEAFGYSGASVHSAYLPDSDTVLLTGSAPATSPDRESHIQTAAQNLLGVMLPSLPSPDAFTAFGAEQNKEFDTHSFEEQVLLLLAAAVADGLLTYPGYELAQNVLRRIFGERALHADMQARFHSALLSPQLCFASHPAVHSKDFEQLAQSLVCAAVDEKVAGDVIDALLAGLDELAGHSRSSEKARCLRELIEIAFAEEKLEHRRRRLEKSGPMRALGHSLEQGALLSARVGKAAASGTVLFLRSVADMAARVLLEKNDVEVGEFVTLSAELNENAASRVDALAATAWTLGEKELRRELLNFRGTLVDQPFRVAVLGEGKRGKSSLVNALLEEDLSPVRESAPETATVGEFYYASQPRYAVGFLDEEQFEHLEEYLAGEGGNQLLRAKAESLRQNAGNWKGEVSRGLAPLFSRNDLPDYLAVEGRYSSVTARVAVGLPVDILRQGMVLMDTPGLNATDSFQDYLAYEECLRADCLLVVLDARRPDSASELRLLRKLAASGRALSVIGVLTGCDRLNDPASAREAADRALLFLQESCRGAQGLSVLGLVSLNAREAMQARCHLGEVKLSRKNAEALESLLDMIRIAMRQSGDKDGYRTRVAARATMLAHQARDVLADALTWYRSTLPSPQFLELLDRHADRLAEAAVSHAEQARSVVAAAAYDVARWRADQAFALDAWQELLELRIMDAAHRHADSLGNDFAKESAWKDFDNGDAVAIARQSLDEFLVQQQGILRGWQEKLLLFQGDVNELAVQCLSAVQNSVAELGDICSTSGRVDHLLVKSNAHMRNLAVFLAGAGTGAAVAGSLLNLMLWGSAAVMVVTNPLALPGVALMGVAAYALHAVGNTERRKAVFMERKRKKTVQWASEARLRLEAELDDARDDIAAAYKTAVARGFVPALEILAGEAAHLRLYLAVMDKICQDASGLEHITHAQVQALEEIGGARP